MAKWRSSSAGFVLASTLLSPGCFFKKSPPKASIVIPPPPPPAGPAPLPEPPVLPPSKPQTEVVEVPKLPPPAPAKPQATRTPRRQAAAPGLTPPATEPEAEEIPAPVPAPAPLPSLQPILGSQEIQQRNQRISQYLEKARTAVARAERGNPSAQQRQLIGQVRTFVQQAEDARRTDLVRAENLAERAEVLSRGLSR